MAELKTKKTNASVMRFLRSVENERRRNDGIQLLKIFKGVTKKQSRLWGSSIVGFGEYHHKSERSSQEGDWPLTGFSPRKSAMNIYIMPGFTNYQDLMSQLGQHKSSVSCVYFTKLEKINVGVLKQLIRRSVTDRKRRYNVK